MILDLNNERMTINGDNILAFEGSVDRDIRRVEGAGRLASGLFNVVLEGTGKVAATSHGEPVLPDTLFGETFQISFEGPGWVLIQPSEGSIVPEHSHPEGGGGGSLGSLFGSD